ncbi:MAG TPA: sterol desaturase family protein [Candidatus Polarisedimenticolia bacterium]|nr:sterol desaturase family protein [Candidatus Polarisedimenticolia bacterium]
MDLTETQFQLIKSIGFVASFAAVYALQAFMPYRREWRLGTRSWLQNIPLAAVNTIVLSAVCGACLCTVSRYAAEHRFGLFHVLGIPASLAAPATLVVQDCALWLWHMVNHRLAWLWRFHRVHHSDGGFDLSTSLRFHAGELLLSLPLRMAVIAALGAPLIGVLLFEILFGLFNILVHANLRLPAAWENRLLPFIVLPCAHRLHHSVRREDHQSNFGTVFSIWDRWFGTWREARSTDAVRTGLPGLGDKPLTLWRCLILPFHGVARTP